MASSVLDLCREALDELDRSAFSVTAAARKAVRVARLRGDWEAVYWLSVELEALNDKEARYHRVTEVAPYFTRDEMRGIHTKATEQSLTLRAIGRLDQFGEIDKDKITSLSIPELEAFLEASTGRTQPAIPSQAHPHDAVLLYGQQLRSQQREEFSESEMRKVLARISQRIHTYLSRVEYQLLQGQEQADFFDHNRKYVEARLKEICPLALEQLQSAHARALDGTVEGRSHALTSCRRAMKSLADKLYPPRSDPIVGADGKARVLDDSKFVARLWQYLSESSAGSAARRLIQAELQHVGSSIDRLNELSSKGVHDQVTPFEVTTCVLGMYSLSGALLRLQSEESAASVDPAMLVGE